MNPAIGWLFGWVWSWPEIFVFLSVQQMCFRLLNGKIDFVQRRWLTKIGNVYFFMSYRYSYEEVSTSISLEEIVCHPMHTQHNLYKEEPGKCVVSWIYFDYCFLEYTWWCALSDHFIYNCISISGFLILIMDSFCQYEVKTINLNNINGILDNRINTRLVSNWLVPFLWFM